MDARERAIRQVLLVDDGGGWRRRFFGGGECWRRADFGGDCWYLARGNDFHDAGHADTAGRAVQLAEVRKLAELGRGELEALAPGDQVRLKRLAVVGCRGVRRAVLVDPDHGAA